MKHRPVRKGARSQHGNSLAYRLDVMLKCLLALLIPTFSRFQFLGPPNNSNQKSFPLDLLYNTVSDNYSLIS